MTYHYMFDYNCALRLANQGSSRNSSCLIRSPIKSTIQSNSSKSKRACRSFNSANYCSANFATGFANNESERANSENIDRASIIATYQIHLKSASSVLKSADSSPSFSGWTTDLTNQICLPDLTSSETFSNNCRSITTLSDPIHNIWRGVAAIDKSGVATAGISDRRDNRVNLFTSSHVPSAGVRRRAVSSWLTAYVSWLHWVTFTGIMLLTLLAPTADSSNSHFRHRAKSESDHREGVGSTLYSDPLLCYMCADHNNCASSLCSLNRSNVRDQTTMRAYDPRHKQPYCYKEVRSDNGIKYTSKGCMLYNPGMATCFGVDMMDQSSGTICLCNSHNFCNGASRVSIRRIWQICGIAIIISAIIVPMQWGLDFS